MEYPKTIEEARAKLQGRWQTEDGKISFEIKGDSILNIKGLRYDLYNMENSALSLVFNTGTKQWSIYNISLFGYKSNISQWDNEGFTVTTLPGQAGESVRSIADNTEKRKFIRNKAL